MRKQRNMPPKFLGKCHCVHFVLDVYYWAWGSAVEKTNRSFAGSCPLEIAFWLGMGTVVCFPISALRPVCINLCGPRTCCLWAHTGISPAVSGRHYFLGAIHSTWLLSESFFVYRKYANSHSLTSWLQKSGVQSPLWSHSDSVPFSPCRYNYFRNLVNFLCVCI